MGWSSGTDLAETFIKGGASSPPLAEVVPDEEVRKAVYRNFILAMWNHDWDTDDEVLGLDGAFDAAHVQLLLED